MKFLRKGIALLLAMLSFVTTFSACEEDNNSNSSNPPQVDIEEPEIIQGEYLLKNRLSEYKIVLPDKPLQYEQTASEEFNYFFEKATGVTLPVIYETGLEYDENSRYISLGENIVQEQAEVTCKVEEMNRDGYIIKTVGKSIFIMGGGDLAVLYGVYTLLNETIEYECYGLDNYYYETNVANIALEKYDIVDIPDVKERIARHGTTAENPTLKLRMRYQPRQINLQVGNGVHVSMNYLPTSKYLDNVCTVEHAAGESCFNDSSDPTLTMDDFEKCANPNYHPSWYMSGAKPTQLCYTARGDAQEYELMQEACLEHLIAQLKIDLVSQYAYFGLSDDSNWCTCEACKEAQGKYKAPSGAVIIFLNDLVEKVYDWFETEEGKPYARDFYLVFMAYITLEGAPVVRNADGSYSPAAPEVKCNKKVIPYMAYTVGNYTQPLSTGEKNKTALENIKSWAVLAEQFWVWTYVANYRLYLVPLDTFGVTQDWYQTLTKYSNIQFFQAQGKSSDTSMSTGFIGLQTYLDTKLAWDVNADVDALTKNYFKATYRDAWEIMYKLYNEYRVLSKYNETMYASEWLTSFIGSGAQLLSEKFWPKNKLEEWRGYFDVALEEIEYLKSYNPELYDVTVKYIRSERVWVNYVYYKLYNAFLPSSTLAEVKSTLLSDLIYCDIKEEKENVSVTNLKNELAS